MDLPHEKESRIVQNKKIVVLVNANIFDAEATKATKATDSYSINMDELYQPSP